MQKALNYGISYSPPLPVRDEPHRTLDTLDQGSEEFSLCSEDYGQLFIVGQVLEFEAQEIADDSTGSY